MADGNATTTVNGKPLPQFGPVEVMLPSGAIFKTRRPSIMTLFRAGAFPQELTDSVMKLIRGDIKITTGEDGESRESMRELFALIDNFLSICLISPKVGEETNVDYDERGVAKGTIRLEDIPDADKYRLWFTAQWLYTPAEEVPKPAEVIAFRDGPESVPARPASAEVRPETVGDDGLRSHAPGGD